MNVAVRPIGARRGLVTGRGLASSARPGSASSAGVMALEVFTTSVWRVDWPAVAPDTRVYDCSMCTTAPDPRPYLGGVAIARRRPPYCVRREPRAAAIHFDPHR